MFTKTNSDGTWNCQGVDFKEINENVYGALCKLHDYEKSGFEPENLYEIKEKVHIGLCICRYTVYGVWNGYCIAENLKSPYPYVVWKIASDGYNVYEDFNFKNRQEAEKKFFELATGAEPDRTEYWKK